MNVAYHAVRMIYLGPVSFFDNNIWQWGHSMAVDPMSVYIICDCLMVILIILGGRS